MYIVICYVINNINSAESRWKLVEKDCFQAARDAAESSKKWLLVNVQDSREFACQMLNRDVWSSEAVKTILREHFVFWQQYQESEEAQRYMTFYPVTVWPHIAVRTPSNSSGHGSSN